MLKGCRCERGPPTVPSPLGGPLLAAVRRQAKGPGTLHRGPAEEEVALLELLSLRIQFSACNLVEPMASILRVDFRAILEHISVGSLKTSDCGDHILEKNIAEPSVAVMVFENLFCLKPKESKRSCQH